MCTSQPSPPKPTPPPEPLKRANTGQQQIRDDQRRKAMMAFGLAGTNKTGGTGLMGAPYTAGKSLLGQ